jgi:hypothetical protein
VHMQRASHPPSPIFWSGNQLHLPHQPPTHKRTTRQKQLFGYFVLSILPLNLTCVRSSNAGQEEDIDACKKIHSCKWDSLQNMRLELQWSEHQIRC